MTQFDWRHLDPTSQTDGSLDFRGFDWCHKKGVPETWLACGDIYKAFGMIHEALQNYMAVCRSTMAVPEHSKLFYKGILLVQQCYLMTGDFAKARTFHEYSRACMFLTKDPGHQSISEFPLVPTWFGEPIEGKTILFTCKQPTAEAIQANAIGYGDIILGARYIKKASENNTVIVYKCPAALRSFLEQLDVQFVESWTGHLDFVSNAFGIWTPLKSKDEISGEPYLKATPNQYKQDRLNVGICWNTSEKIPVRAVSKDLLKTLSDVPANFYCLEREDEPPFPMQKTGCNSFQEIAEVIAGMDVVVTPDAAYLHVAGSIGTPCLSLIPKLSDPRWFMDTERTPWYDSVRLFKQEHVGDYTGPIERVKEELIRLCQENTLRSTCS